MKEIVDGVWNASASAVLGTANQVMTQVLIGMVIILVVLILGMFVFYKFMMKN